MDIHTEYSAKLKNLGVKVSYKKVKDGSRHGYQLILGNIKKDTYISRRENNWIISGVLGYPDRPFAMEFRTRKDAELWVTATLLDFIDAQYRAESEVA